MCCTCTTFGTLLDAAKRRQTVMINIDGSKWIIFIWQLLLLRCSFPCRVWVATWSPNSGPPTHFCCLILAWTESFGSCTAWAYSLVHFKGIKSQISQSSHNCLLCQPCIWLEIDDYSALAMLSGMNLSATSYNTNHRPGRSNGDCQDCLKN